MERSRSRRERGRTRRSQRVTQVEGGPPQRRARNRVGAAFALIAIVFALLAAGGFGAWWYIFDRADVPGVVAGEPVEVEIPEGAATVEIAQLLSAAGVVPNANRFRLEARLADADGMLRAGTYDLVTGLSYDQAITELRDGPSIVYTTLTIPEGWVIEQIAERVEAELGISAEEFSSLANGGQAEFGRSYLGDVYQGSLEGYLFPKTYRIPEESSARDIIEMMLDQFELEIETLDLDVAYERGFTLHEVVTMASIIERETRVPDERPVVSSVIHNRLERGMRLEIDATIEYLLPGTRFRLLYRDLEIESPFNTYKNAGLPPGPIASPGLASLEAAVGPDDTDYIYYVLTDPDGSHSFTETWEEFLIEKDRSKEVFGQ